MCDTYTNAIDTVRELALELCILWRKILVDDLIITLLHLAEHAVVITVLIFVIVAVLGNVAVALLSRFPPPSRVRRLITECREADGAPCFQRCDVREVQLP